MLLLLNHQHCISVHSKVQQCKNKICVVTLSCCDIFFKKVNVMTSSQQKYITHGIYVMIPPYRFCYLLPFTYSIIKSINFGQNINFMYTMNILSSRHCYIFYLSDNTWNTLIMQIIIMTTFKICKMCED